MDPATPGMNPIGLIGGMSWESTAVYYRIINETVRQTRGGLSSAEIRLSSLDFEPVEAWMRTGEWEKIATTLARHAQGLARAGAGFFLICTNTMHKLADPVEEQAGIPLLHIVDPTAQAILDRGIRTVGLLGTRPTMEDDFYTGRLQDRFDMTALVPEEPDRHLVHDIIFEELCLGRIREPSRQAYLRIIQSLADQGAQAVILGCTEISLLVNQADTKIPLFDTTRLHAEKAAAMSLEA